jgi:hypothetical protein
VNVIMLVGHCTFHNDTFEFAPQHTGQCSTGVTDVELLTCENEGKGTNPVGVWRASSTQVYASAGSNDSDAVTFIAVPNWISLGMHGGSELRSDVPGIPVHFNPPRGLFWKQYGYPDDEGVWELKWCLGHDQSSVGNLEMASADCTSTFKSGDLVGAGTSGGPWVNSRFLANAAGAVHNQALLSENKDILRSVPLDDDAMRAYIRAVLASCGQCGPGPLDAPSPGHAVAPPSTSSHVSEGGA